MDLLHLYPLSLPTYPHTLPTQLTCISLLPYTHSSTSPRTGHSSLYPISPISIIVVYNWISRKTVERITFHCPDTGPIEELTRI